MAVLFTKQTEELDGPRGAGLWTIEDGGPADYPFLVKEDGFVQCAACSEQQAKILLYALAYYD